METLHLPNEKEEQFMSIKREGSSCWRNGDWQGVRAKMQVAWDLIPEPKPQYDMSYIAAWMMCEALLQLRDFEAAKDWIDRHNKADLSRMDSGEREFMEGRFLFAEGKLNEAKEKFHVAYQKSDGRLFKPSTNNAHEKNFKEYEKLLDEIL